MILSIYYKEISSKASERMNTYFYKKEPISLSYLQPGSPSFRKANTALFIGGFISFAILYSTQPLLPVFSEIFGVPPASASLSLSLSTVLLAISMLITAPLSDRWGRKRVMSFSLFASAVVAFLTAFSPDFLSLLFLRSLQGIVLAGLPAIAMTYVGEEFHPDNLGTAMGLYVSGTSIGGMTGRVVTGMITDYFSWSAAFVCIGIISLIASLWFWHSLPESRHFHPRNLSLKSSIHALLDSLKNPVLVTLFGIGFLLMGGFVTMFNYMGYLLVEPPYRLSQTAIGWIFVTYLTGTFSSAWMGKLADRIGRPPVLITGLILMGCGCFITLTGSVWIKVIGLALFTFGFFGSHSVTSGWVGKRSGSVRAQATTLYLLFYYIGSSLVGSVGGLIWSHFHWTGIIGLIISSIMLALLGAVFSAIYEKRSALIKKRITGEKSLE